MKNSSKSIRGDDLPDGSVVTPTKVQPSLVKTDNKSGFKTVIKPAAYIGSFLVDASTQKERAEIVYKKLETMRNVTHKKNILLVISLSGIKVCNESGESVRMAHALRRISYATSDPDYCQFSFLAREPKGQANAQYCHTFLTDSPNLAEELNDIVGEAFRFAFEKQKQLVRDNKTPSFNDIIETQINNNNNSDNRISSNNNNNNSNTPISNVNTPTSSNQTNNDNYNLLTAQQKSNSSNNSKKKHKSSSSKKKYTQPEPLPMIATSKIHNNQVTPSNNDKNNTSEELNDNDDSYYKLNKQDEPIREHRKSQNLSHKPPQQQQPHPSSLLNTKPTSAFIAVSRSQGNKQISHTVTTTTTTTPTSSCTVAPITSSNSNTAVNNQTNKEFPPLPPQRMDSLHSSQSIHLSSATTCGASPHTLTGHHHDTKSSSGVGSTVNTSSSVGTNSSTTSSTSSHSNTVAMVTSPPKFLPTPPSHHSNSNNLVSPQQLQRNTQSLDNLISRWPLKWYLHDIPRDVAMELLSKGQVGNFVVRDSTSHNGCYALSVRVAKATITADINSGIVHYLIVKTNTGFKLKGLDKEWPTMKSLVTHLSVMPEMLPCPLLLVQSKRRNTIQTSNLQQDYSSIPQHPHSSSSSSSTSIVIPSSSSATNPIFCPIDNLNNNRHNNKCHHGNNKNMPGMVVKQHSNSSSGEGHDLDGLLFGGHCNMCCNQNDHPAANHSNRHSCHENNEEDDEDLDYQRLSDFSSIMADLFVT